MPRSLFLLASLLVMPGRGGAEGRIDYRRDVKPILKEHCFACHGALSQKAKLRLDTAAAMRQGGRHGPAVVAGQAARSLLVKRISASDADARMPPDGVPLTAKQIALVSAWVRQGAHGPAGEKPEQDPRLHWAFRPPLRPPVPAGMKGAWAGNPIDAFVGAEHDRRGLQVNPEADRGALLRRVSLDLIGLPPTREELRAFRADPSGDAYEKVVDRLLASPRHGERWARHWMDVWRYSDWYGRRGVPDVWNSAPQVWRWRDWIVGALNADRGYDRMVREMLAADEIAPADEEAAVATGYLVRNWYALNPNQWMRDLVEHTGKAFLGLTMNCAHCHDHKYDPISQQEYFRFRAFFEPLQLRQDRVPGEPDPGPFQKYEYSVLRKVALFGRVGVFDERPDALTYPYEGGDERNRVKGEAPVAPGAPAFLGGDRLKIEPIALPPAAWYPGSKPFIQAEEAARCAQAVTAARAALEAARLAHGRSGPAGASALRLAEARLATAEASRKAVQACIAADTVRYLHASGSLDERVRAAGTAEREAALCVAQEKLLQAEQAVATLKRQAGPAAALKQAEQAAVSAKAALEGLRKAPLKDMRYSPLSPLYPEKSSGRRRALAGWIVARDNPLAARVAVNHVWKWHFGRPLVDTVFDFGRNGKGPSHPELLDWLAVEFMESGWSMKHLHRLIVTSSAYRVRSGAGKYPANRAADPDNRWLWRFERRRIEAEAVRDAVLHAAGALETRLGGPPLDNGAAETSHRRSLYFSVHPEGGGHPAFLELFDAPNPCDCYRRSESLVPQQALALTNSQLLIDQSRLLAGKLTAELTGAGRPDDEAFIVAAFERLLTRGPSAQEQAACTAFLRKQAGLLRQGGSRPREGLIRVLFNHNDFVGIR